MSEQVFGYKGKRKVSIPDPLFLYIEWEIRATPENNSTLRELIEDLDQEFTSLFNISTSRNAV